MSDSYTVPKDAHGHPMNLQHHFDTPLQQFESGKMGMWIFLMTEILFFGGIFCAYSIFRAMHPEIFHYASQLLDWKMGAINTVVLICSSLTMAWSVRCAQLGQKQLLIIMLSLTIALAGVFMAVKYVEYSDKFAHGYLWGTHYTSPSAHDSNAGHAAGQAGEHTAASSAVSLPDSPEPKNVHLFFGIYFFMTGLHGVHVLGGMIAIGWLLLRAVKGHFGPGYATPVDAVGLYWHLVDLIWIFLFPLLYLIA